ncbi:MAG TPA: serine/threonine-protein kinase [Thermoanaerobaculia bacterium]|nr:serine/threonine-protein kinase [Thermoanaerobaculia bacterium]
MQSEDAGDRTAYRPPEETPTLAGEAVAPRPQQLTPGVILGGRYRIVSLIGRGGMGEVYRADDLKLGERVALKFLAGRGESVRLHEEVRIARQVSHPNVCRVHDIVEVDARLFITMEFVDGEDLASLLRRVGRLPVEKALAVARDLAAGLAAAHDKDVIHRDLKPGNVMIDGRGRARITDFGLAVAEESRGDADTAGTPAYMAPEQLDGGPASKRSDIYALGLMLYEIFTGRRTFTAASLPEMVARQRALDFSRPSSVVRDIDPAVERLIVRCLDPDPQQRPASGMDILRELPGGDPLAAAIAAGETPSPAMVAAAMERGELSPRAAWSLLAVCVALLAVYASLTSWTTNYRRVPQLKSSDTLADRVAEILAATPRPPARVDAAFYYFNDADQPNWKGRSPSFEIAPIQFFFRQSPRPLSPLNFEHLVRQDDPPLTVPGMSDVIVDGSGRLMELVIVPPQFDPSPRHATSVDWTPFLRFAGVPASISPAPSLWAAPVDSDEKRAWTIGTDGTRIEAASYRGQPVWFALIPPWRRPLEKGGRTVQGFMNFTVVSGTLSIALFAAFGIGATLLALRNLRRAQGDRRGAMKIALFFFATTFITYAIRAHYPPDAVAALGSLAECASLATLLAAAVWLGYIAIEPLVRRRWPRWLISWSRLLGGQFRDPMVGRDVLIGIAVSMLAAVGRQLTVFAPGAAPLPALSTLAELRHLGYFLGFAIIIGVLGGLMGVTVLLTLQLTTRNFRLSLFLYGLASTAILMGDPSGPLWSRAAWASVATVAALAVFVRFGLLAGIFVTIPMLFLRAAPVTLDTNAWYFGRSAFALLLVAACAFYAFKVSLGDKRWLPEFAMEE